MWCRWKWIEDILHWQRTLFYFTLNVHVKSLQRIRYVCIRSLNFLHSLPVLFIDRINLYFNLKSLAAYMLTSGSWEVLLNDFCFTFRILCSPVICLSHWYNYTHTRRDLHKPMSFNKKKNFDLIMTTYYSIDIVNAWKLIMKYLNFYV